jgi:hypothetical protein
MRRLARDCYRAALIAVCLAFSATAWAAKPAPKPPPPTKPAPGPAVSYGVTTTGAQPTMTLSCDRNRWKLGDVGTYTCVISMPADSPTPAWEAVWWFQVAAGYVVEQVTGPARILNVAVMTWTDDSGAQYQTQSPTPVVWASNVVLPNRPDAQRVLRIELGDLWIGESEIVAVTVRRV